MPLINRIGGGGSRDFITGYVTDTTSYTLIIKNAKIKKDFKAIIIYAIGNVDLIKSSVPTILSFYGIQPDDDISNDSLYFVNSNNVVTTIDALFTVYAWGENKTLHIGSDQYTLWVSDGDIRLTVEPNVSPYEFNNNDDVQYAYAIFY